MANNCTVWLWSARGLQAPSSAGQCLKLIYKAASLKRIDQVASEQVSEFDCLGSRRNSCKVFLEWLDSLKNNRLKSNNNAPNTKIITAANKKKNYKLGICYTSDCLRIMRLSKLILTLVRSTEAGNPRFKGPREGIEYAIADNQTRERYHPLSLSTDSFVNPCFHYEISISITLR